MPPGEADDAVRVEAFARFETELERAVYTGRRNMNAMALATVSAGGHPSVRHVLLRHHDRSGFVFFTDRRSEKGRDLLATGVASACLYWEPIEVQVRIDGTVEEVARPVVDVDFAARPRPSQLLLWGPAQSSPIAGRAELESARDAAAVRFGDTPGAVDTPPSWTGFRLVPDRIEFWAGARDRLHDRVAYAAGGDGWERTTLAP